MVFALLCITSCLRSAEEEGQGRRRLLLFQPLFLIPGVAVGTLLLCGAHDFPR